MADHLDAALLGRIAGGDQTAFASLYDRTSSRVFGLLLRMLRSRAAAEDVLQDAYWHVWSKAGDYDATRSGPLAWIVLIARSRAMDHLRRRKRRATTPLESAAETQAQAGGALEDAECGQVAGEALRQLPDEQRRVIELSYFGGLTHEEIASRTQTPVGTVKTRIRLGMRRLREIVQPRLGLATT